MYKNKKGLFVPIGLFLLSMAYLVGCSGNQSTNRGEMQDEAKSQNTSEEIYELAVNNFYPSTHPWAYGIYEPWKKFVEERTNGRIVVNLNHAGTLGTVDTALSDIQAGLYDLSYIAPSLHPDTELFPLTIGTLPFALPESAAGTRVMQKFSKKYGEFEGYKYLGTASSDPFMLFSREPIRKTEDTQGKKYNITGKNDQILIEGWGAIPVSVPRPDMYEAIQKRTVDGALNSAVAGVGSKFYEVAPYLLDVGLMAQPIVLAMNQAFYDQLPEDLKQIFDEELGPKLIELFVETYTNEVDVALKEFTKQTDGKGEITTLSPEEESKLKAPAKEVWNIWVEEANRKGYAGEEMLNDFKKFLQEEGIDNPF